MLRILAINRDGLRQQSKVLEMGPFLVEANVGVAVITEQT